MNEVYIYILVSFIIGYLCARVQNKFAIAENRNVIKKIAKLADELAALNNKYSNNLFQDTTAVESYLSEKIPKIQIASYDSKVINSGDKSTFGPGFNDRFGHLRSFVRLPRSYFEETYNFPAVLIEQWESSAETNFIVGDLLFYIELYPKYFGINVSYEWLVNDDGLSPKLTT